MGNAPSGHDGLRPTALLRCAADPQLGAQAWLANCAADVAARHAAALARLPEWHVQRVAEVDALADAVQSRILAVQLRHLADFGPELRQGIATAATP